MARNSGNQGEQDDQVKRSENQGGQGSSARGFASMDPDLQKEIASKGGQAAHQQGVAHEFNSEEAREAGRKGGETVSQNREHMAAIGKKGGESKGRTKRSQKSRESGVESQEP
jgi:general stress protein YciG